MDADSREAATEVVSAAPTKAQWWASQRWRVASGWRRACTWVQSHIDSLDWDERKSSPYRWLRRPAYGVKALLQMAIGVHAVVVSWSRLFSGPEPGILEPIAHALAAAAVVELAYTLFTPGPDEVLDPLMLGLTSVLLLRLAEVDHLEWREALATLFFVSCLAMLFAVKKFLALQGHTSARSDELNASSLRPETRVDATQRKRDKASGG